MKFNQKVQVETFSINSHNIQFIWFLITSIHGRYSFFPPTYFNLNLMF